MRRLFVLVALLGMVAAACGSSEGRDFDIGFKRVLLDLAYQDEKLAEIPPPRLEEILLPLPVPSQAPAVAQVALPTSPLLAPTPLPKQEQKTCGAAGPDDHPEQPATVFVREPPKPGFYTTHNEGTVTVQVGGLIPTTLSLPKRGLVEIKNITHSESEDPLNGPTEIFNYDVFAPGLDGGTTTTYRLTYSPATVVGTVGQTAGTGDRAPQGELALVRLQIKSGATNVDFQPEPPVTIVSFRNGQGTRWNSAGIDQRDGTSMVVQGQVTQRKNIDLCGTLYDTYEVVSNEHIANLQTGLRSDTSPTDPNVYHVATRYGGLFIHQHINTTASYPGSGAATIITAVYDQTFDAIAPVGSLG